MKCNKCNVEIKTEGLPKSDYILCAECSKTCDICDTKDMITDPKEMIEALNNDPLFKIGYKSPYV